MGRIKPDMASDSLAISADHSVNPTKPKVLVVATTFPRWSNDSLPSFIYDFAQSLKVDCQIQVLAPHADGAKVSENMNGVQVHRFVYAPPALEKLGAGNSILETLKKSKVLGLLIPPFVLSGALKLTALHIKNHYDVIHVHWLVPFGPMVGLLRLFSRFRYVITAHGSDVFPFSSRQSRMARLIAWLHRALTFRKADEIVAVSSRLREAILKMSSAAFSDKVKVISMGIHYDQFALHSRPEKIRTPLRLVFVGRLAEFKGVTYLIDAMRILRDRDVDFELQIYGDGLLRNSLEKQSYTLGLADCVNFNGFVPHSDLAIKLAESDILLGPSITTSVGEMEGFGLVFLEALAAGLIVIASNNGGIPDIIRDRATGILVAEKDPKSIADAVMDLCGDPELQRHLMSNGRRLAMGYDWSSIAETYLTAYGFQKTR
jgi:glycosyltransferase involved in cell wall biosynthesis